MYNFDGGIISEECKNTIIQIVEKLFLKWITIW